MGQYTFRWHYPANEVYVTGTFDDWKGSVRLEKNDSDSTFSATVDLGDVEKILFKFIVDGNWTVSDQARIEKDFQGFENNVLFKDEMSTPKPEQVESDGPTNTGPSAAAQAVINSVSPESTTAGLAADVPLVTDEAKEAAPASQPELPTPAFDDVPGGFPDTPASMAKPNPVEEQTFSVKPLPASTTPANPIDIQPGQPIPDVSAKTVDDTVRLDKESYEQADRSNLGVGADFLPPVVTPAEERAQKGTGILDIPEITSNMIPESSLPIEAPETTEEQKVGEVPEIVKESQQKAHVEPEASAVPEMVEAKREVEKEVEQVVPEAPATAEGGGYLGAASEYATKAKDAAVAATTSVSEQVGQQVNNVAAAVSETVTNATNKAAEQMNGILGKEQDESAPHVSTAEEKPVDAVPEVVKESQAAAHIPPEAAANPEAVAQKAKVEDEIVHHAPELHRTIPKESHDPVSPSSSEKPAENVPDIVKESIDRAHVSPEAAANPAEVALKEVVEYELKKEVSETKPHEETEPRDVATDATIAPPAVVDKDVPSAAVVPTIRKVEPEPETTNDENAPIKKESKPDSPGVSPLATPPVTATTHTFTTPVAGTTFNGSSADKDATSADNASSSSGESSGAKLTEKNSNGTTPSSDKKVKRRSIIFSKIKHVFKRHSSPAA